MWVGGGLRNGRGQQSTENWGIACGTVLRELGTGILGCLNEFQLDPKSRGNSVEFYAGT